jgi:phage terminase small subunit
MALQNPRYERFAYGLAEGKPAYQAYIDAGFAEVGAAQSASRLLKSQCAGVRERVAEILQERNRIRAEATKLAIERSGITKERVAVELGRIGFANMADYADVIDAGDDLGSLLRRLPRDQTAALTEVTVDDYVVGRGENARDVRKVKFKLGDKRAALMDIAKLFGWIVEKRENKIVDEFENMSNEEIEAWLDERAEARVKIKQRRLAAQQPRRGRQGGIGTLRPTTAPGKPH